MTKRPTPQKTGPPPQRTPPPKKEAANSPIARIDMFPVSASVWQNYTIEGQPYYTTTIQKTYKDGDDTWQYTDNMFGNELLLVAEAARLAFHKVNALRAADREDSRDTHKPRREKAASDEVPF